MLLALLDNLPEHACGRGCDVCAEHIGARALGVVPAYSATLTGLADASERVRTAATVGDYIAACEDVRSLRTAAARLTPSAQLVDVPSC